MLMADSRSTALKPESLGDRVRRLRRERSWTQDQLAAAAGVSKSFVSEVESGASQPRGPVLVRIATALKSSLDYLLTGRERPAPSPPAVEVPTELASFARRCGLPFQHVELLLEFHNSIEGMRRDQPPLQLTEREWEEFYESVRPLVDRGLRGKERGKD